MIEQTVLAHALFGQFVRTPPGREQQRRPAKRAEHDFRRRAEFRLDGRGGQQAAVCDLWVRRARCQPHGFLHFGEALRAAR